MKVFEPFLGRTLEYEVLGQLGQDQPDHFLQETSARYRAVEPSSGSNVIPTRARHGLAGLGLHSWSQSSGGRWSHWTRALAHNKTPTPTGPD